MVQYSKFGYQFTGEKETQFGCQDKKQTKWLIILIHSLTFSNIGVDDNNIMTITEDTRAVEICPYTTAVLMEFEDHVKGYQIDENVATQSSNKCSICEFELPNKSELVKHKKKPHKKGEHCPFQTNKLN